MKQKNSTTQAELGKRHSQKKYQINSRMLRKASKNIESIKNNINASFDVTNVLGKAIASGLDMASEIGKNSFGKKTKQKKINVKKNAGWTQDVVPIDSIINGVIKTTDKKYVKIIEILPINFKELSYFEKDNITETYAGLFKNAHVKTHLKITTDRANPSRIIDYIYEQTLYMKNKKHLTRREDLINHVKALSRQASLSKRFFIIFEYEGEENGRKSKDEEIIINTMHEYETYVCSEFIKMKNSIVVNTDRDMSQREILYYYFNRKTSQNISINQHIETLVRERESLQKIGIDKKITEKDCVAPTNLNLFRKEFMTMDDQYYTYLAIKDESYPSWTETGWMQLFSYDNKMDLDIYTQKLPRELVKTILSQITKFQGAAPLSNMSPEAKENVDNKLQSNRFIERSLQKEEDIFNFVTILTIRADSRKELKSLKHQIVKALKRYGIHVEDTFLNAEEYFNMTMPLMNISSGIFLRNSHNFVTSSLGSTYLFTSYELFDPTGYVLGLNDDNNSLIAINNFNTDWFRNGNMAIMGTSGAGKTFTEMTIAQRMFFMGIRTHFIIPAKGFEYHPGCIAVDGSYISLRPGSEDCINIMDIYPETIINTDMLDEESRKSLKASNSLSKQIIFLTTWIQLNMGNTGMDIIEKDELDVLLVKLYNDFGITEDDNSLYSNINTGKLKPVPIIEDMYNRIKDKPNLKRIASVLGKYVSGSCKNMNGQTNVDIKNNYTVYDVDERSIDPELFPAFLYIAFKTVYSVAKSTNDIYDAIFLDEIWKLLANEIAALQVKEMVKIIRGYAGCAIIATQDIDDFLSCKFGAAVLGNTEIKLFLGLLETELKKITEIVSISPEDQKKILSYEKGYGMLFAKRTRVTVNIKASQQEFELFNTDPKAKKEIEKRKKMQNTA